MAYRPHAFGENGHRKRIFSKRSPEWRFLKTLATRLRVDGRKRGFSDTMMLYIIYYEHNVCSVRDAIKTEGKISLFKQKRIRQTQATLEILKTIPKRVSTYQLNWKVHFKMQITITYRNRMFLSIPLLFYQFFRQVSVYFGKFLAKDKKQCKC